MFLVGKEGALPDIAPVHAVGLQFVAAGWNAVSATNRVDDGIDTLVFADGIIRAQTVRYTLKPAGGANSGE